MHIHLARVIRLVDFIQLDDVSCLHKMSSVNQVQRLGNPPPPNGFEVVVVALPVKTVPVTTLSPSFKPESTSVEMPSLMPVLICTGCNFAFAPSPEST